MTDVDDVETPEPPHACPRPGCDERFWTTLGKKMHLAKSRETPDSFRNLEEI